MTTAVLVDGLMCVGKTTLLNRLTAAFGRRAQRVEEVVIVPTEGETSRRFFQRNDRAKLEAIRQSDSSIVLVDRSFASTFAYSLSFAETEYTIDRLYRETPLRDLDYTFVYLRENPELSFGRAKAEGRSLDGQWGNLQALARMSAAYDNLYANFTARFPRCRIVITEASTYWADRATLEAEIMRLELLDIDPQWGGSI